MLSSIQLSGGDVYLQDIAGLTASPELMVLSTCDSAAAAVRAGDEVVGIGAALLQLGTKSVVATSNVLPDVAETVEFVTRFHDAMEGGRPPSMALVDAERHSARTTPNRWRSPQPSRASARAEATTRCRAAPSVRGPAVSRSPAPASTGERPARARRRTLRSVRTGWDRWCCPRWAAELRASR